jgi:hypothetical protein
LCVNPKKTLDIVGRQDVIMKPEILEAWMANASNTGITLTHQPMNAIHEDAKNRKLRSYDHAKRWC